MNILITGGLGHIGTFFLSNSHYIKEIKNIYVIDQIELKMLNLINLNLKRKINFINQDLSKKKLKIPYKNKINLVMHLASITNASESFKKKIWFIKIIFHVLKTLLTIA